MITAFEVGAVLKIVNEASPTLLKILRQVRELNAAIDKTKANMAGLAKLPALGAATAEVDGLATAWRNVATQSAAAQRAMIGTAATAARSDAAAAAGGGGRGGRHQPGFLARGSGGGAPISAVHQRLSRAAVMSASAVVLRRLRACSVMAPLRCRAERRQPRQVSQGVAGCNGVIRLWTA
jgi:hypothetical protein